MGDLVVYLIALALPILLLGLLVIFSRVRRRSTNTSRRSLLAGNALVLSLLLSLLFLAGETYFRFFQDATDSYSMTRTSRRWFHRHFHRNNAGFRDSVHYAFSLAPGRRRVSLIGDSFTAGHGIKDVEDRFGNRIRQLCRGSWDVHVLAEVGRDTGAELKLVKDLRRQGYQFDVVVLVYCLNDLSDLVGEMNPEPAGTGQRVEPYLVEHSFLVNTLYYRLRSRWDRRVSGYFQSLHQAYDGPIWRAQQQRLVQFKELIEQAGGQPGAVIFPFVHSLGAGYEYRGAHRKLTEFFNERSWPCLDLQPVLEPHADEGLVVSRFDAHPNERAHDLAGQAIYPWLRDSFP